jgi:hypothetical protein
MELETTAGKVLPLLSPQRAFNAEGTFVLVSSSQNGNISFLFLGRAGELAGGGGGRKERMVDTI